MLFTGCIIDYIENIKEHIDKLLPLSRYFSKIVGYKSDIQKSIFLNEQKMFMSLKDSSHNSIKNTCLDCFWIKDHETQQYFTTRKNWKI